MWSVVKENAHLVHLKEEQITNETKLEFLTKEEEECIVLFHNIRNLDVKLQLGHPLPLQKANSCHCLDTTFIQDIDFQTLAGPHSAVYIVQVICSTTSGNQYKFDVGVFCLVCYSPSD
jgi:hypothetical protein